MFYARWQSIAPIGVRIKKHDGGRNTRSRYGYGPALCVRTRQLFQPEAALRGEPQFGDVNLKRRMHLGTDDALFVVPVD